MGKTYRGTTVQKKNIGTLITTPTNIFKATTPGRESIFFTTGISKDAANYLIVKQNISRHLGTQSYCGTTVVSRVIEEMVLPIFTKPTRPTRMK